MHSNRMSQPSPGTDHRGENNRTMDAGPRFQSQHSVAGGDEDDEEGNDIFNQGVERKIGARPGKRAG